MRLGKTAVVHFSAQVTITVSGFVATFAIARVLGPSVFGTYAVAIAVMLWLNVPANAVGDAVVKRVSEGVDRDVYLGTGLLLGFVLAVGSAVIPIIGLTALERTDLLVGSAIHDLVAVRWVVAALVAGNVLFITVINGLEGQKRVAQSGLLKATERIVRTVFQVGLILLGAALTGIIIGHVVALVLATLGGLLLYQGRFAAPTREHLRSLLSFARYSWLGSLQVRAFAWMDTIVLAVFVESALIGIYEVSWSLASVFALMSISIQSTLFPEMSDISAQENYDRIHHYLNEALTFAGLFVIPGLFGVAIIGDRVLKIYRPEFTKGALILVVLVFARMLAAYGSQMLSAINAIDRPDVAFRINLGFVAVNMTLNVLLVWWIGWHGAAVATTLSAGLLLVLSFGALSDLIGRPSLPVGEFVRQVVAGAIMAGVVLGLRPIAPRNHYATVGLAALGAGVYVLILLVISTRVRGKVRGLIRSVTA